LNVLFGGGWKWGYKKTIPKRIERDISCGIEFGTNIFL
jgi:hypothetical protein